MRRLTVTEFRTLPGVALDRAERDAIRRLHPGLRIEPTIGSEGLYDITADQRIGVVSLPTVTLEIRPKVPITSVLFLLSHAHGIVQWLDHHAEFAADADLVDIVAVMMARMVEHATRRGLLTGYQSEDESLSAPRGRIRFDDQIRRWQGMSPPVEVRRDVFTSDVLENRLLAAALSALGRLGRRSQGTKRELARAQRLFGGVARVHYPRSAVPDVVFTRLNRHYESAVSIGRLVLQSASLDLGPGGPKASAFLVDMNAVFERFVRNALRTALGEDSQTFPDRPPPCHLDTARTILLRPDLCLLNRDRAILWVGDAKYKRLPAGAYQNADVYQLLAYALAFDLPGGLLIYAADTGVNSAEHVVVHGGKRLHVVALDLSAPPSAILQQVDGIARAVKERAQLRGLRPPLTADYRFIRAEASER